MDKCREREICQHRCCGDVPPKGKCLLAVQIDAQPNSSPDDRHTKEQHSEQGSPTDHRQGARRLLR